MTKKWLKSGILTLGVTQWLLGLKKSLPSHVEVSLQQREKSLFCLFGVRKSITSFWACSCLPLPQMWLFCFVIFTPLRMGLGKRKASSSPLHKNIQCANGSCDPHASMHTKDPSSQLIYQCEIESDSLFRGNLFHIEFVATVLQKCWVRGARSPEVIGPNVSEFPIFGGFPL